MKEFRVWDNKNNKMHYDDFFIGTLGELYILHSYYNIDEDKYIVNLKPANMKMYSIMFACDIYDCNGSILYEGDIIEINKKKKYILTYNKQKGYYFFKGIDENISMDKVIGNIKCIGNIYENNWTVDFLEEYK